MKNKYLKGLFGLGVGLFLIGTSSYAISTQPIQEQTTNAYKKWQSLSTEEKQQYMEPMPYGLDIDDSVKISVFHKFTRGVGSANTNTAYNLREDVEFVVKNQQDTDECWAFATTTALETNVAMTRNKTIELSPRHIDYATSRTFLDGINKKGYHREIGFGNFNISLSYCTSGNGPVYEEDMPFKNDTKKVNLSEIQKKPVLKIEDYVRFATIYKEYSEDGNSMKYTNGATTEYTEAQVKGVRSLIKQHIKQYGGVMACIHMGGSSALDYLNIDKINQGKSTSIAYCSKDNDTLFDHAVTIVGWDDNYSRENFNEKNKPEKDGAYLVVNTGAGENGILSAMYVSYEDVWIEYNDFGVIATSDINYDTIYQYDEYGYNAAFPLTSNTGETVKSAYIANVFSRKATEKEEFLQEVSVYVANTSNVEIYTNTESDDKTKITKVASAGVLEPGYHTIKLATPLKLTGSHFVIAMKLTANEIKVATEANLLSNGGQSSYWDYATSEAGQSFLSEDGTTWTDMQTMLKDCNPCIKAFTTYQEKADIKVTGITLNKTNVDMQVGESLNLVATITPNNATNKKMKWSSENETIATISETGIITALKEGTTTITATTEDGNKTATCKITVKKKENKEDDVYYPDTTTQDGQGGKDTTTATGTIPQTGRKIITSISVIVIILAIGGSILVQIKYRDIQ